MKIHVLLYRGRDKTDEAYDGEWSILIVKANGEVFGSGRNSLIEDDEFVGAFPMKKGGITTGEFVRVKMLSKLKPKKLAVGLNFGVALTNDNELFKWGRFFSVPKEMVIMVQAYKPGPCHCGNSDGGRRYFYCGIDLTYCPHTSTQYKTYTHCSPPPPGVAVWQLIRYDFKVLCFKCEEPCDEGYAFGGSPVNICKGCGICVEVTNLNKPYQLDSGVVDVDAGEAFVCSLSEDFKLKLRKENETIVCKLPEGEMAKSVSCGIKHFAVITKAGNLYSYGDLEGEQMRPPLISLRELIVPERALEVSCWKRSTACLLKDKTVYLYKNGVPLKLISAPWIYNRSIKPVLGQLYENSKIIEWMRMLPKILGKEFEALCNSSTTDRSVSTTNHSCCCTKPGHVPVPHQMKLYGQKLLSDLTIKLADDDVPAHWMILITTSQYFQKIFQTERNPSTLDMTSYNPRAYRCLLQHFYQVPPNELPVSDLLDLLELATSYEEQNIVKSVTESLKSLIQVENVLKILPKARSLANQDLIEACEIFILSPTFKDHAAKIIVEDPTKLLL